jgi:hypothetical protein
MVERHWPHSLLIYLYNGSREARCDYLISVLPYVFEELKEINYLSPPAIFSAMTKARKK